MKTTIQFKEISGFKGFKKMVDETKECWPDVKVDYDDTNRIAIVEGMSEKDVMIECYCLRTCYTAEECWVVK